MSDHIPFEKPLTDLEHQIDVLRRTAAARAINLDVDIAKLETQYKNLRTEMFSQLTAYETTQIARHPRRPNTLELINAMCTSFVELHGDRNFLDDKAIVGGLAKLGPYSVVIIGHQKGRGTRENILRNFGMPRPEGYRKALRLMSMAERFSLPIITLIDTPGAFPGIDAEERGQSEAIAKNIMIMSKLGVPIVSVVVGEGGSGGALALAVADRVHMLQYAIYSVISPEGCASILFKSAARAADAAESLQLTAGRTLKLGVIDSIIDEPEGGAHRNHGLMSQFLIKRLLDDLDELTKLSGSELRERRQTKYLSMGIVSELASVQTNPLH